MKADAYGHGSKRVALFLEDKCDYFAVASLDEGMELRAAGIKKPILVLSYTSEIEFEELIKNDITATVYEPQGAKLLSLLTLTLLSISEQA